MILYIPDPKFTRTQLKQRIGDFTLHNGCFPQLIVFEEAGFEHFLSLVEEHGDDLDFIKAIRVKKI